MSESWHRFDCPNCGSQCKLKVQEESPYSEWSSRPSAENGYYQIICSSCNYKANKGDTINEAENNYTKSLPDDPWSEW